MENLIGILLIACLGYGYWQQRRQTERAQQFIEQRCQTLGLQLLNIARGAHKIRDRDGRWYWHTLYYFEFSANGVDAYQGHLIMQGFQLQTFYTPPHHMPE